MNCGAMLYEGCYRNPFIKAESGADQNSDAWMKEFVVDQAYRSADPKFERLSERFGLCLIKMGTACLRGKSVATKLTQLALYRTPTVDLWLKVLS